MAELLKIILPVIALLALAFIGLGINIFFKKSGRFPETSVGGNREMRKRGITCVREDELKCHNNNGYKGKGCCC